MSTLSLFSTAALNGDGINDKVTDATSANSQNLL